MTNETSFFHQPYEGEYVIKPHNKVQYIALHVLLPVIAPLILQPSNSIILVVAATAALCSWILYKTNPLGFLGALSICLLFTLAVAVVLFCSSPLSHALAATLGLLSPLLVMGLSLISAVRRW